MTGARQSRGRSSRRNGRRAEVLAAVILMLKGYRILGFRIPTRAGEVDILAVRGATLAVVEVKRRADIASALEAVGAPQRDYLRRAGRQIAASKPQLRDFAVRLDLMAIAPGRLPRHIPDAWPLDAREQ